MESVIPLAFDIEEKKKAGLDFALEKLKKVSKVKETVPINVLNEK